MFGVSSFSRAPNGTSHTHTRQCDAPSSKKYRRDPPSAQASAQAREKGKGNGFAVTRPTSTQVKGCAICDSLLWSAFFCVQDEEARYQEHTEV